VPRTSDNPSEVIAYSAEAEKGRWQRKTPREIRRVDRRLRFNPVFAVCFSLFAATVMTLAWSWGFRGNLLPPFPPMELSRAFRVFPLHFLFMFLGMYVLQLLRRIPKIPDRAAMICDQCHQVTDYTTDPHCPCGGRLELLAHWRWVRDGC
jgi:hypothetical protein